jgi:large subunit ribosomal protein L4
MAQKSKIEQSSGAHVVTAADLQIVTSEHDTVSPVSFAQCIKVLRQNWRQGTVGCKDRSEVAFANRKPWKQKGTGRARAGSLRSPLWRKGGVTFGPQARTRVLTVPHALKRGVMRSLLWNRLEKQQVIALDHGWSGDKPSSSQAFSALKTAQLHTKKVLLFVDTHDYQTQSSFANIPSVEMYLFDQPNVYALSQAANWVYLKKDADLFKRMVNAWI